MRLYQIKICTSIMQAFKIIQILILILPIQDLALEIYRIYLFFSVHCDIIVSKAPQNNTLDSEEDNRC